MTNDVIGSALSKLKDNYQKKHVLAGFDGFVDEIIHVVDKRINFNEYKRIETIEDYGKRIIGYANLSGNLELVPTQVKLGGNGTIKADAMLAQDYDVTYIGSIGKGQIHPVFKDFADACKQVISFCEPGHTDALEFYDGKLMMGKMEHISQVNWENLMKEISRSELLEILKSAELVSFNNWTMLPNMNSIMEGINELLAEVDTRTGIFLDLADPKKRSNEDIKGVLNLISLMEKNADFILSMNKNESIIIAEMLGINEEDVIERAKAIREKLDISYVVIHPLEGAAVATKDESVWVDGPYTDKPKLTTGAGDNFNAGFCSGWLQGFNPAECLAVGVFTSGFYVTECHSPNLEELFGFMEKGL